jgi:hypothetical protein
MPTKPTTIATKNRVIIIIFMTNYSDQISILKLLYFGALNTGTSKSFCTTFIISNNRATPLFPRTNGFHQRLKMKHAKSQFYVSPILYRDSFKQYFYSRTCLNLGHSCINSPTRKCIALHHFPRTGVFSSTTGNEHKYTNCRFPPR